MYNCPLCKQEVTKELYEKITGLWSAKEKALKDLKEKEKQIARKFEAKLKQLTSKSISDQARQKKQFESLLLKKQQEAEKKRKQIEGSFQQKLAAETNRILKQSQAALKDREKALKATIEKSMRKSLDAEKKVIQSRTKSLEKKERIQRDKNQKLLTSFNALKDKSQKDVTTLRTKVEKLEEQLKKNETPQMLGLLEEKRFLAELEKNYPHDKFSHTGKGGDILHEVMDKDEKIGTIIYELKKVGKWDKKHVEQTYQAKQDREADYGLLVTNAKSSKNDIGFSTVRGIIIIHPAGAIVLINLLRYQLQNIAKLRLSKAERNKAIQAVMTFVESPKFTNSISNIIDDTIELYNNLQKETKEHIKTWQYRLEKYRNINSKANLIDSSVTKLIATSPTEDVKRTKITTIALPAEIS